MACTLLTNTDDSNYEKELRTQVTTKIKKDIKSKRCSFDQNKVIIGNFVKEMIEMIL